MLYNVTIIETLSVRAIGQHCELYAQFESDTNLAGDVLLVDVALFIPVLPTTQGDTSWFLIYPTTPGTYEMTHYGADTKRNYEVDLEVIDAYHFKVVVRFLMRADVSGFISESIAGNAGSFTQKSYQGVSSVYGSQKYFAIKAEIGGSSAYHARPFGGSYWQADDPLSAILQIGGVTVNGYEPGQDLDVVFSLAAASVSSAYDIGLMRIDDIDGSIDFVSAHELHYAAVTTGPAQSGNLPTSAITSANPMAQSVSGVFDGAFTIDGSYFTSGATYRFYIVYSQFGVFRAALSDEINQRTNSSDYPATYGSVSCSSAKTTCADVVVQTQQLVAAHPGLWDWTVILFLDQPTAGIFADITGGTAVSENGEGSLSSFTASTAIWTYSQGVSDDAPGDYVDFELTLDDGTTASARVEFSNSPLPINLFQTEICAELQFDTCCVENICPGDTLRLCSLMDEDEYNDNVIINGVTGDYDSNLVSRFVGIAGSLGSGPFSFDSYPDVYNRLFSHYGCVDIPILEAWAGQTLYVVFVWHFDLGTHQDYIYKPYRVTVGGTSADISIVTIRNDDNEDITILCTEYEGNVHVCLENAGDDCTARVLIGESGTGVYTDDPIIQADEDFSSGQLCVEIDGEYLEEGKQYCIRVECIDTPDDPGGITCQCFDVDVTQSVLAVGTGQSQVQIQFTTAITVDSVEVTADPGGSASFESGNGIFQFNVPSINPIVVNYTMVIAVGGCVYQQSFTLTTCNVVADSVNRVFDMCTGVISSGDTCDNLPVITTTCDEETGEIDATFDDSGINSTIDTEDQEMSEDGTTWVALSVPTTPSTGELFFRWTLTFTDDCKPLTVFGHHECDPATALECNNQPDLSECMFDADAETLAIEDTGIYGSAVLNNNLQYSTDGGLTWSNYTSPISTSAFTDGQITLFRLNPEYSDGCPQGPEVVQECIFGSDASNCDYSSFALACTRNGDDSFEAEFTGDTTDLSVNQQQFTENGGASWSDWTGTPVVTASQFIIFRWVLQFEGCEPLTLISGCAKECCPALELPDVLNINIANDLPLSISIDGCVQIEDCVECETPPEAGTASTIEACDEIDE